jgi:hypothetical protein
MFSFQSITRRSRRWPDRGRTALYSAVLAAAGLGACATVPPSPTPEMTRAESAIEQAQRAGAPELAPQSFQAAERKLSEAKTAVGQRDNAYAAQLVEEAYAEARLADLSAQSEKSAKAAAEVDTSIRTLENEANRPRSP